MNKWNWILVSFIALGVISIFGTLWMKYSLMSQANNVMTEPGETVTTRDEYQVAEVNNIAAETDPCDNPELFAQLNEIIQIFEATGDWNLESKPAVEVVDENDPFAFIYLDTENLCHISATLTTESSMTIDSLINPYELLQEKTQFDGEFRFDLYDKENDLTATITTPVADSRFTSEYFFHHDNSTTRTVQFLRVREKTNITNRIDQYTDDEPCPCTEQVTLSLLPLYNYDELLARGNSE